ncbi:MAG: hypothetical protein B6230_05150 [Desulfobacteraceae bacterium 4572_89]|nr:MAG: hypothetical protein B6230_05150 [Desulfobacteraceae bacterium 4572_89]
MSEHKIKTILILGAGTMGLQIGLTCACSGFDVTIYFTTNSSTLVPSMIADATCRPDRFAALHFHDCAITNVVDVMPHPGTSAKIIQYSGLVCGLPLVQQLP